MPIAGLGLHFLVAIFFAVHALRSGQNMYWLLILFSFPLLGSIVYFLVVYLPDSRLERGARRVVRAAGKALDPTRELREAREAFEYTPTAQNQMRLAQALLEAGESAEAAANYEACLKGPFAADPDIRWGAARAFLACGRPQEAVRHLEGIRAADPQWRAETVSLLMARALSDAGRKAEARQEFESARERFGSFEVAAEYAIWAATEGERELATHLKVDVDRAMARWNRHAKTMNEQLARRVRDAFAGSAGGAR